MRWWMSLMALFVATAVDAGQGVVIWYSEQEEGIEPYPVRYIVTDDFLRSDNGGSDEGFVLLDRRKKIIYNVVPSSGTILVIDGSAGPAPPPSLHIDERRSDPDEAPTIAGRKPREIQVYTGERFCYGAVVVPGLDESVGAALAEFAQVLAARQLQTLENTPPEMRDDCYLARYVYAPARHLAHGLPVEEWDAFGRRRRLIAPGETVEVDDALFELPQAYRRY